ncbi:MAG: urea ABC transporter substrate-binding protein [Lamprocystis purpurea]|uniref:urea ABC transporter substrate-binding protein n=1 Tax=Lamprocystis purpurea TaxID=61598 RepID=UPI00037869BC|nr:urea ABC transporter substrate-binding protein [Lamprocystis purpurea]MBV5273766.1 urea ABC transporter substrate-binding protein [Lamprocystis purpurea]
MASSPVRLALLLVTLVILTIGLLSLRPTAVEPIRIGAVHALSGVMAESERGLVDAVQLAVDEINRDGGLLERHVELMVADSRSDWTVAANQVERLILKDGVSALFGCWTSACRQAVRPVVEKHHHLLFYPLQYEGLEQSPNIVYMGSAPNQQIIPGARWALDHFGRRIYLVGSDYVFPRTANQLIRDLVIAADGEIIAERYVPLDATAFADIAADIRRQAPDAVLNTLNGTANRHFFAALAAAGADALPVVSFSMAEPELQSMRTAHVHAAHYAVWGYFQSLPHAANQRFVADFRQRFGPERVISDPVVTSYDAVRLWAAAVRAAGTPDPAQINRSIGRMGVDGPSGIVAVDAATRHLWRRVYVGRARADGQFEVTEISEAPVRPVPFPPYRGRDEWLELVRTLLTATDSHHPKEAGEEW